MVQLYSEVPLGGSVQQLCTGPVLGFHYSIPFGGSAWVFRLVVLLGGSVQGVLFEASIQGFNNGVLFGNSAWGYHDMAKV